MARCRFFVVPGDSPVLLGVPNFELLGVLKILCEVLKKQQADRKIQLPDNKAIQ